MSKVEPFELERPSECSDCGAEFFGSRGHACATKVYAPSGGVDASDSTGEHLALLHEANRRRLVELAPCLHDVLPFYMQHAPNCRCCLVPLSRSRWASRFMVAGVVFALIAFVLVLWLLYRWLMR